MLENETRPLQLFEELATAWCEAHPVLVRLAAYSLPGIGIGSSIGLMVSDVNSLQFIGSYLAPGWALGGPIAAALVVTFDGGQASVRSRLAQWVLYVGLSLALAFPIGFVVAGLIIGVVR